jgi:hypothetical protein
MRAAYLHRVLIGLGAITAVACISLLAFARTHRVYSPFGWTVYRAMSRECHPAWQDYHFGRVKAGDPVEEVIARTRPDSLKRKGRYVELYYGKGGFTGMWAAACDGRMVTASAGSCGWTRLFFDELTEEQCLVLYGTSKSDPDRWGIAPVVR